MSRLDKKNGLEHDATLKGLQGARRGSEVWLGEILKICRDYYEKGFTQADIARSLRCSKATISRAIKLARKENLVRIIIQPPFDVRLASELVLKLKDYGIVQVVVAGRHGSVGGAAARFFEAKGHSGATVVLDGGNTVGEFVRELVDEAFDTLKIIPICADPPSYSVSAYELMTRLSVKIPQAACEKLPHHNKPILRPIRERIVAAAQRADFVFLGTGPWKAGHTASEFVRHLGFDPEIMRSKNPDIASVCGYCAMDSDGRSVRFPRALEMMMPRALDFKSLRRLAADRERMVALLVAGQEKLGAVLAVLNARICNTLIVDGTLANLLLERAKAGES